MKRHGAWCTQNVQTVAGTSHGSAVSTPVWWMLKKRKKRAIKKLFIHVESHASAVPLLKSGE